MTDYWGPVCRFALRFGAKNFDEAEDAAAQTFQALWENRLLVRWVSDRSAKLRTLLCKVVRNTLSHRNRVRSNRAKLAREMTDWIRRLDHESVEQIDAFYAAWVEDIVGRTVESLAAEYYRQSKDDYFRVLYGRLCQQMTMAAVAEALEIKLSAVDNYYRAARRRLGEKLQELLRRQIQAYYGPEEAQQEFAIEWQLLGDYLTRHGGIEEAVRRAYELLDPVETKKRPGKALAKTITQITSAATDVKSSRKST